MHSRYDKLSRRGFLKWGAYLSFGLSLNTWWSGARAATSEELSKKLVKTTDPTPKAFQYSPDAEQSNGKGKGQTCSGCVHFTKAGKIGKDEVGTCALFQMGTVYTKGWCMAWAKKPG